MTGWVIADLNVGVLYLFAISSLGVYGIIMGGWASNSKYPVPRRPCVRRRRWCRTKSRSASSSSPCCCCVGSLNLTDMVKSQETGLCHWRSRLRLAFLDWYWLPLFPMFVIFFVSALAETNRPPFDLGEAESELVAGFMVEYSSTPYLLFMLG
jgi:NADH-quinone oxidoreductase subunit H